MNTVSMQREFRLRSVLFGHPLSQHAFEHGMTLVSDV